MRKKLDFVTNSSSTSFVILCKEELSVEEFINNLWEGGFGDKIKEELIRTLSSRSFPLQKGVNKMSASSDDYDCLFSQLFYNFPDLWWKKDIRNDKFCMNEGYVDSFVDDRSLNDDEFLKSFPEEYHPLIEEYIKANK